MKTISHNSKLTKVILSKSTTYIGPTRPRSGTLNMQKFRENHVQENQILLGTFFESAWREL
jgi:hypothetical protein